MITCIEAFVDISRSVRQLRVAELADDDTPSDQIEQVYHIKSISGRLEYELVGVIAGTIQSAL